LKAFGFYIKTHPFLTHFKPKDFEIHFSFENKELLPFYLKGKAFAIKLSFQKNFSLSQNFETRFWKAHFGFAIMWKAFK
jgi:hypothetical protein